MRGTTLWGLAFVGLAASPAVSQEPTARDTVADSVVTLPPINVTVTRRQSDVKSVPYAVATLSGEAIRRGRTTVGLDESMVEIPGVFVANRYNFSLDQRLSIRGFGARSAFGVRGVKVLLDGIPQTLPDGQGQLTNVDLATVGSVEVLRGSSSSLYGNASGGVVSFRSASPDLTRANATARVTGGTYDLVKWQVTGSAPVGRGAVAVNASQIRTDGYRRHSDADQRQFSLRLEQEVAPGSRLLVAAHVADAPFLENPGSLTADQVEADPAQANQRNVDAGAGKEVTQGQLGVSFSHRGPNGSEVDATVFGLTRDLVNPLSFAFIQIDRRVFGLRGSATFPLGRSAVRPWVTVGFDLQRQRDDRLNETADRSAPTRDQLERVTEVGPFVQVSLDLTSRLTTTAGVRYDRVSFSADDRLTADGDDSGDRVMSALSGSVGAVFEVTPDVQGFANVGTSFETPTTTELANRPSGGGGFNPELEPQNATTVEVGLRGTIAGRVTFDVAAFHAEVRDELIPFEVPTEPGRQFFRNAGSARHRGIELGTTIRLPNVSVVAAYTFADYEFEAFETEDAVLDGNSIPGIPDHFLYASVRFGRSTGPWLAIDNTYSSSSYVDDANSSTNGSWVTSAVRGGWQGSVGGWRIAPFGGVLNVFGERYNSSVVVNAGFGRYFEPAPPRNVYVGLEIRGRA